MLIKMAWRNLFRHKKRTLLTLVAMTVGIMLAILGEGLNKGMYEQVRDTYIKTDIGYYKIYGKDYYEDTEGNERLEFPIQNINEVEMELEGIKHSSRILFPGSITNTTDELNTLFVGADRLAEEEVFNRLAYMLKGSFLESDQDIVIGSDIATLLDLDIGMEVTILGRTYDKAMNAYDRRIGGIIKTGNPLLDSRVVFTTLDFAREFVDADIINDIVIGQELNDSSLTRLTKLDLDLIHYNEELSEINTITLFRRRIFGVISTTILIMAGLSIANTMLMAMMERKREIGVMMANGMSRDKILKLFLLEGGISGSIGGLLGFFLGSAWVIYYERVGLALFDVGDAGINLPLSERLFFGYSLSTSLLFLLVGIVFAILASFYPAYKATTMEPVEVIRGDS